MFTLRGCPGTNHAERRPRPRLSLPYESDNLKQKSDKKPRNSDTSTTGAGNMDSQGQSLKCDIWDYNSLETQNKLRDLVLFLKPVV